MEKLEVYECGEPTIGSSFVQFDLRFYVVALLFIIFDVEVAFFFPWAAVFGKATQLAAGGSPVSAADLDPTAGRPGGRTVDIRTDAVAASWAFRVRRRCRTMRRNWAWRRSGEQARRAAAIGPHIGIDVDRRHRRVFRRAVGWFCVRVEARRLGLGAGRDAAERGAGHSSHAAAAGGGAESVDLVGVVQRRPSAERLGPLAVDVEQRFIMAGPAFVDQLKAKFGDKIAGANFENIDPWIEVTPDGLLEVCRYLRDEPSLAFDYLNCISGVDYLHTDEKKAAKAEWQPHTEVVYHLFSMKHKHSLVLKVILPRWKDDKPGELPEVPSVSGLWSTADWHEREVYDLSRRVSSPAIRICGAFCAPKIGSAIRCARTMRCRSNITEFGEIGSKQMR